MIEVILIATGCVAAAAILLWIYRLVRSWGGARSSLAGGGWDRSPEGIGLGNIYSVERSRPRHWIPTKSGGRVRKPWGW